MTILGDGTGGGEDRGELPSTFRSTTRRRSPARRSCAGVPDARRAARAAGVPLSEGVPRATIVGFGATAKTVGVTGRIAGASCGVLSAGGGGGAAAAVRSAKHSPQVPPSRVSLVAGVAVERWTTGKPLGRHRVDVFRADHALRNAICARVLASCEPPGWHSGWRRASSFTRSPRRDFSAPGVQSPLGRRATQKHSVRLGAGSWGRSGAVNYS